MCGWLNLGRAILEHGGMGDTEEVISRGSSETCLGYAHFLPQHPPRSVHELANWTDEETRQ
jgi:hypothetical protein